VCQTSEGGGGGGGGAHAHAAECVAELLQRGASVLATDRDGALLGGRGLW
jgi:hypothetical protein